MFKAIKENVSAEIVEKKSKFIANIFYVETREEAENIIIEQTLAANKGNKSKTAEILGIGRKTLYRKFDQESEE